MSAPHRWLGWAAWIAALIGAALTLLPRESASAPADAASGGTRTVAAPLEDLLAPVETSRARGDLRREPWPIEFLADLRVPIDTRPADIATGDFNGDGRPDLVMTDGLTGSLVVLHATGGSPAFSRQDVSTGVEASEVSVGDVNGDGRDDIAVVADRSPGVVLLLLNDGGGGFREAGRWNVGRLLASPLLVDLDRDGDLDFACVSHGDSSVAVLRNRLRESAGERDLLGPWWTRKFRGRPSAVTAADFTGDGLVDLAACNVDGPAVMILPGLVGGGFGEGISSPSGRYLYRLVVSDFDSDGDLDLAGRADGAFVVLRNRHRGDLLADPEVETPSFESLGLCTADVDADGDDDLVVANYRASGYSPAQSMIVTYFNDAGRFRLGPGTQAGPAPVGVVSVDVNADGLPDVLTANGGSFRTPGAGGGVSVLFNCGAGRFAGIETRYLPDLPDPLRWGARCLPLSRPGNSARFAPDLLIATTESAWLAPNDGHGWFGSLRQVIPHRVMEAADLDGDGITDVIAQVGGSVERVLLGRPHGAFEPAGEFTPNARYSLARVDGDKLPDLIVWSERPAAMLNLGHGRFGPPRELAGLRPAPGWHHAAVSDFDGDSRHELLAFTDQDSMLIYRPEGVGAYRLVTAMRYVPDGDRDYYYVGAASGARNFADGGVDLVVLRQCSGCGGTRLLMLRWSPDGSCRVTEELWGVGSEYSELVLRDLDRDGRADVVIGAGSADSHDEGFVQILRNLGDGHLERQERIQVASSITSMFDADVNADGTLDLVTHAHYRAAIAVLTGVDAWNPGRRPVEVPRGPKQMPGRGGAEPLRVQGSASLTGSGRLSFTLPVAGPAELSLYDLAGRRVLSRDLGWLAAGEHAIEVPDAATLRPGIYWARVGAVGSGVVRKVFVTGAGGSR